MDIQVTNEEHVHEPYLKVLESVATCEKTALCCKTCGEQLSEPTTEC
ncbi:hypothetical protein [uncultured Flavobacterium sp.]|nr:hypothetical protein [uncultured Flavobacterium sp.]